MAHDHDIFLNAFTYASIGMAIVSPGGAYLKVNKAICEILGYKETELMSMKFQDITHPDDFNESLEAIKQMLAGNIQTAQMEKRYFHKKGHLINGLLNISLVHNPDGIPRFFISQLQDITRRKQLEEELTRFAKEDFLTKIANRRYFIDHATREMTRGDRFHEPQALLMLDIDHFKDVNDTYGHDVGDTVLIALADCCKKELRSFDVLGRLGGEEFGVLLINIDSKLAHSIAERLRKGIEKLIVQTAKGPVTFTVSIGLTTFQGGGNDLESRLKLVDRALYRAKNSGRNCVVTLVHGEKNFAGDSSRTSFISLVWKKEYESGNSTIDNQHRKLFILANDLLSVIITGGPDEEVSAISRELITHTVKHFHDEDIIFRKTKFPLADEHSRIHNSLVEDMRKLVVNFQNANASTGELFDFLAGKVVAEHMLTEDKKFFPYLSDH
ncbi:PAS domain S-box-containing protein/diguanylate cyclase (GGDEF) domain-containing protein/hemerythrin-like metal-binding domain protein [Desulfovibrio gilichinskyi]|uniref:PAS domain S-box-containing protein/diguanylate cyclase (GGDEF) domain-containing protein/hemerythrin-like metal-binding domain protein n=2 Tax=Desulfovibrio gilichinskyi TaxID=1519643 RepID=A0A1X7ENR5_9BACT|nr:PAS domain S-box-containing protein/diguanylate cyclase (GGDEF) domain-containing protein/hemerythrin-like metal-binding domain protein [Desulfovibrio gilichinskyi]